MPATAHWDDAPHHDIDMAHLGARWHRLGEAAGSQRAGLRRIVVEPGRQSTPQHAHFGEEELFYVLGGSGFSVEEEGAYAIAPGDVILYPSAGPAHTILAGDEGIDVLAFGDNLRHEAVRFPRLGLGWVGGLLVDRHEEHQFEIEQDRRAAVPVPAEPDPRPEHIRHLDEFSERHMQFPGVDAQVRFLGRDLGATYTALNWSRMQPHTNAAPRHCHSAIEELFVVLDGDGTLQLGDDEHPIRAGSVISRPAGSGVAHGFVAGDSGMTLLLYSDKNPNDMVFYPDTGKVLLRGLGITIKPEIVPWGP